MCINYIVLNNIIIRIFPFEGTSNTQQTREQDPLEVLLAVLARKVIWEELHFVTKMKCSGNVQVKTTAARPRRRLS